jgi:hypothetical protein
VDGGGTNLLWFAAMTRLTIAEAPAEEFSVRGRNVITEADDEGLVFYDEVTKVHVLPEENSFTIQVITPDLEVEMDFPDANSVREALSSFEAKKVSEVNAEAPDSVRISPIEPASVNEDADRQSIEPAEANALGEAFIKPDTDNPHEQIPSRPDQRPSENLPDTQKS